MTDLKLEIKTTIYKVKSESFMTCHFASKLDAEEFLLDEKVEDGTMEMVQVYQVVRRPKEMEK